MKLLTFPMRSGRSSQGFDVNAAFHSFHVLFPLSSFAPRGVLLRIEKFPRSAILDRNGSIIILFENSSRQVFGVAHVELTRGLALQYVEIVRHRRFYLVGLD
jgi:hypothetical protein